MNNKKVLSQLIDVNYRLRSNPSALVSELESKMDAWKGKNAWIDIESLSIDKEPTSGVSLRCRVQTRYREGAVDVGPEHSRFALHLVERTGALATPAYIACGNVFQEHVPSVIVRKPRMSLL